MLNVIQLEKHGMPIRLAEAADDYEIVRRTLAFITDHWRRQPTVEEMAEHVGLSPGHLHHLFRRWAGLTPKDFLQAITLDAARALLRDEATVLDTAYEVGYSGPGRLHDLFVTHEAMSPGEFKTGGEGLTMRYGFHPSPFGQAIVVATDRGLAGLGFCDAGGSGRPSWWRRIGALPASASATPAASPRRSPT